MLRRNLSPNRSRGIQTTPIISGKQFVIASLINPHPSEYSERTTKLWQTNLTSSSSLLVRALLTKLHSWLMNAGIDKIPIRVIKDCLNPIGYTITSIVNESFLTCVFPSKWKVTPIPNDGDHEQPNNNRLYLRFAKGLYTINSLRICNQMTPYQRLKAVTRDGIRVKRLSLKQLTQFLTLLTKES